MQLLDVLLPSTIFVKLKTTSKKQVLQTMAQHAAVDLDIKEQEVFDALIARERLGSTGIGHGVAIPHARFDSLKNLTVFFAQLSSPIDFDSIDNKPIDLIFMLVAPKDAGAEHLKMLARISRLVRDEDVRHKLRGANDSDAVHAILTQRYNPQAA